MKTILLIACLVVAGCSDTISSAKLKLINSQCLKNDGIKYVYAINIDATVWVSCNDGAEFTVTNAEVVDK